MTTAASHLKTRSSAAAGGGAAAARARRGSSAGAAGGRRKSLAADSASTSKRGHVRFDSQLQMRVSVSLVSHSLHASLGVPQCFVGFLYMFTRCLC